MTDPTIYELAQLARGLREAGLPNDWLLRIRVPEKQDVRPCLKAAATTDLFWELEPLTRLPLCVTHEDQIIGTVIITNEGDRNFRGYWQQLHPAPDLVNTGERHTIAWPTVVAAAIDLCIELHDAERPPARKRR